MRPARARAGPLSYRWAFTMYLRASEFPQRGSSRSPPRSHDLEGQPSADADVDERVLHAIGRHQADRSTERLGDFLLVRLEFPEALAWDKIAASRQYNPNGGVVELDVESVGDPPDSTSSRTAYGRGLALAQPLASVQQRPAGRAPKSNELRGRERISGQPMPRPERCAHCPSCARKRYRPLPAGSNARRPAGPRSAALRVRPALDL